MAGEKSSGRDFTSANGWTKDDSLGPPHQPSSRPISFEEWLAAYQKTLRKVCDDGDSGRSTE